MKLTCCRVCTPSLASAASNHAGTCHSQRMRAWMIHAASGAVMTRQGRRQPGRWKKPPSAGRHVAGSAQAKAPSGRATTKSGAATTISISCCSMCAENSCAPRASSGLTSAIAVASQPATKAATRRPCTPRPVPACRHSRATPRAYRPPLSPRQAAPRARTTTPEAAPRGRPRRCERMRSRPRRRGGRRRPPRRRRDGAARASVARRKHPDRQPQNGADEHRERADDDARPGR